MLRDVAILSEALRRYGHLKFFTAFLLQVQTLESID